MRESKSRALPLGDTPVSFLDALPLGGKARDWDHLPIPCFLGWVKGLEPSTPGTTIRCSNQLSYTHHIYKTRWQSARTKLARQKGFEPLAYCLEGSCSIRLSYWRVFGAGDGNRTRIPSLEGWCPGHCATPAWWEHKSPLRHRKSQLRNHSTSSSVCQALFAIFSENLFSTAGPVLSRNPVQGRISSAPAPGCAEKFLREARPATL